MSFIKRWKGKYVSINPKSPSTLGVCDESGFVFNHKDLARQMEWRGNNLVWTGKMVGKPYLDKPSPFNRPTIIKNDPKPIKNPKLPENYTSPDSNIVLPNKELEKKLKNIKWNG